MKKVVFVRNPKEQVLGDVYVLKTLEGLSTIEVGVGEAKRKLEVGDRCSLTEADVYMRNSKAKVVFQAK